MQAEDRLLHTPLEYAEMGSEASSTFRMNSKEATMSDGRVVPALEVWSSQPESVWTKSNLFDHLVEDGHVEVRWEVDVDEIDEMQTTLRVGGDDE